MSGKAQFRYEIILGFRDEPRVSEYEPDNFEDAVNYALRFTRRNKGVRVSINLPVPMSNLHDHSYCLFICEFPELESFMKTSITKHYGRLPY